MNCFKTLASVGMVYGEDGSSHVASLRAVTPEELRSPANTVFQFTQEGEFSGWPDGSKTTARAYLWVPEECNKLRCILVLCANVPEMMLAGHPEIRKVLTSASSGAPGRTLL